MERSKVLSAYFTRDPEGKLQFKDDLSSVQQANATTTLGTLDKNIGGLQASIDAFKPQKTQVDAGARQLQQLAAEAAAARAELARFPSNGDPFLEALAKSAARASEEIAKINSERKQLGEKPLSLAEISNTSADALTIQLSRLQIESKQKQAEIDKDLVDGAARLNQELAKQDAEEQKKLAVINAQTAAIRLQIDAVGKGFAAQRQAALAGIATRGTAAEERPEAIQAQIAQNTTQSDLDVKATLNQIAQQSAALKREIDAVFKGRDAVRQAEIENIRAQGLANGENSDITQARVAYAQSQFDLQDKQRGVGETADQGVRQWLREMSDATNSVGKEVHDVLGGAFQGLDKQLTDLITGQKTSWASFFRGIAAQIATLTINNAVAKFAKQQSGDQAGGANPGGGSQSGGPAGLGGILAQTGSNALAGVIAKLARGRFGGDSGGDSSGPIFDEMGDSDGGSLSFLDGSGGVAGGGSTPVFDELGDLGFGGFMADGGPLQSNKWYIAGEHGPEAVWGGGSNAFATGYGKGGASTINYNVDARGSDNSAETELRMRRGLAEAHRQGARDGAAVSQERRRRVPNSKAFAS